MTRLQLFIVPKKHQEDLPYLRHVQLFRVHIFTVIQVICLAVLVIVKSIKTISIAFPLMVSNSPHGKLCYAPPVPYLYVHAIYVVRVTTICVVMHKYVNGSATQNRSQVIFMFSCSDCCRYYIIL